jgi:hypothetical protein
MTVVKVYDVPVAARRLMVNLAVASIGALVVAGLALGLVQLLLGGPGAGGPLSTTIGMLFSVVAALAGLVLSAVLAAYVVLRFGSARRHQAAAADLVDQFNAEHDGRSSDA